ncbi:hypothetical protein B5F40_06965 [Gordonibacter sp. An230]|uniref:hypothetical protein n=1 Tax=Gordonibacter sp. An230 TaxID=1965592 RepID=UPI000B377862|nr:hypothetical protein [Gordonibacter sp. An230]OUO90445.1 hypothetical protein B5F40_06965 [Gordonibacter sp. An230]
MGLDEELEQMEDGGLTQAEAVDEASELEDVEEFQSDEGFDPDANEEDLEDAYEGFFDEEGPDGEGETALSGDDGGLAAVASSEAGVDLSEEGFHLVGGDGDVDEAELADDAAAEELEEAEDNADEAYELVELELSDDDIVRYLEDEDGRVIGFVLVEDGEEVEYFYVEDDEGGEDESEPDADGNEFDFGITKEGVAEATSDMNAIYKDGIAVATELKGAFDDIKNAFDFGSFLKK